MKKVVILVGLLIGVFLLLPLISSQIIINQQPESIYNLGEVVTITNTVKYTKAVSGIFQMDLICDSVSENFYKNGVSLTAGEEKKIEASLILTKDIIGDMKGNCVVKSFLADDFALSNTFKISDVITVTTNFDSLEFSPGETITLTGDATKENGDKVTGFIEFSIVENNSSKISQVATVNNGAFTIALSLPADMKAGNYLAKLNVYEQDFNGQTTNHGFLNQNVAVKQVPTNLEIVFEEKEITPGTSVKTKAILRDQSGEKIETLTFISIKNEANKIMDQVEIPTDEFHEFHIAYNELPSTWKVVAASNKLTSESTFTILTREAIKIDIINKTIVVTNMGNVPYNKTAFVKVGNESLNFDVYLDVNQQEKYVITAPDGTYNVVVSAGEESASAEQVSLTGKAVDVRKASGTAGNLIRYPALWIFLAIILVILAIIFVKKSKKDVFGFITSKFHRKHHPSPTHAHHHHLQHHVAHEPKGSIVKARNRAEIALSMKGEKQETSLVAINIRNLRDAHSKDGSAKETLQKIVDMAEDKKAATYEDHNSLIFIFSPTMTKSSKNEKAALDLAHAAHAALAHHNKMFKQNLDYGISLNSGSIIAKHDGHSFKFSGIDTTITTTKKISAIAKDEILMSEKINDKLRSEVKSIKHTKSGVNVYSIKEKKNSEEHSKFLKSFTERYHKENKEHKEHHDHHSHHDHHHDHKDHHDHQHHHK